MKDKISILISNYNNAQYLKRCINSCLAQSYKNKEIIIIPEFQRILNMDKIDLMISSYSNDPDYFNYLTNPLQIVRLVEDKSELYFLIDGQHRFFMYKRLYENKKM